MDSIAYLRMNSSWRHEFHISCVWYIEYKKEICSDPVTCTIKSRSINIQCFLAENIRTDPISTWHYAFDHPSAERTRHICRCYNLPGIRKLEAKGFEFLKNCRMCRQVKGKRNSFSGTVSRSTVFGKQWYADVKGPFTMPSLEHKNQYVFGIIERKTRLLMQYYIKVWQDTWVWRCYWQQIYLSLTWRS
jgi:hypothetical protein